MIGTKCYVRNSKISLRLETGKRWAAAEHMRVNGGVCGLPADEARCIGLVDRVNLRNLPERPQRRRVEVVTDGNDRPVDGCNLRLALLLLLTAIFTITPPRLHHDQSLTCLFR